MMQTISHAWSPQLLREDSSANKCRKIPPYCSYHWWMAHIVVQQYDSYSYHSFAMDNGTLVSL